MTTSTDKAHLILILAQAAQVLSEVTGAGEVQLEVLGAIRNALKSDEPLPQDTAQVVSNEGEAGKQEEPVGTNVQEPACECDACTAPGPGLLVAKTHEGKAGNMPDAGVRKMLKAFAEAEQSYVREAARSVLNDYGYTIYARVA